MFKTIKTLKIHEIYKTNINKIQIIKFLFSACLLQVNSKNKQQIEVIDQELNNLNAKVRQPSTGTSEIKNSNSIANNIELKIREIQQYKEIEENCDQALEKLSTFAM